MPPAPPDIPDNAETIWSRAKPFLLDALTLQNGVLALPFLACMPEADMAHLPWTLCALCAVEGQHIEQKLHKAEIVNLGGYEAVHQLCRSWRWASEVVNYTPDGSREMLVHCYWAMGIRGQSHEISSLVVRYSSEKGKDVVKAVISLANCRPMMLGKHAIRDIQCAIARKTAMYHFMHIHARFD